MKNEKIVPKKKMSKKAQRAENIKVRNTWGMFCPTTRVVGSRKVYDRNRVKRELDGSDS